MHLITSRDNPLFKEVRHLASSAQARRKAGRTLLDGVHLAQMYLIHVGQPSICVVSQSASTTPDIATMLAECQKSGSRCVMLPDGLYESISQVENGVGITFVVETPKQVAQEALSTSAVLLDSLQDPGNLGSILRSAAAAGIELVVCSSGTVFPWSPKVLRAGMGAHFMLRIVENADLHAVIETARVPVISTSSHASHSIYDADLKGPVAWLFGNEGQGVSDELAAKATKKLSIPHGPKMESLNVAAAAAVCFFEQFRQRSTSKQ